MCLSRASPKSVLVVFDERGNQISVPSTRMALPSHRTRRFSSEGVSWFDWGDRLTWAPDGRRVAYSHTADNGLRVLDIETREELPIRYGSSGLQPYYSTYDWSHDGRQLLFSAELADESTVSDSWTSVVGRREYSPELFLYSDSDQSLSRLTRNDWFEFALKWSPDGRRFTYYSTLSPDGPGAPPERLATLEVYDVASGNSYSIGFQLRFAGGHPRSIGPAMAQGLPSAQQQTTSLRLGFKQNCSSQIMMAQT